MVTSIYSSFHLEQYTKYVTIRMLEVQKNGSFVQKHKHWMYQKIQFLTSNWQDILCNDNMCDQLWGAGSMQYY